jgi:hypothetical protein
MRTLIRPRWWLGNMLNVRSKFPGAVAALGRFQPGRPNRFDRGSGPKVDVGVVHQGIGYRKSEGMTRCGGSLPPSIHFPGRVRIG